MKDIMFSSTLRTSYIGRNGHGKQIGLEVLPIGETTPDQIITLSPINSKGNVANCSLDIPRADIPAFIAALQSV